jgi:uncharacterized protein (DUF2252 family)
MRSMIDSTDAFEAWMRKRTDVSRKLLKKKHRRMCEGPFPFLRATFYRWIEQWPLVCPRLADRDEDVLLAVGDLHVENFGVWRNSRQRLVWGVNATMRASCRSRATSSDSPPVPCWQLLTRV